MKWRLRAPATSANLGPGFDCLGVALDLWNEVEIETLTNKNKTHLQLEGEGAAQLPHDESHLMLRAAFDYLRQRGLSRWPRLRVSCLNRVPLARGLGSSAATRVLGVMLGQLLADGSLDTQETLRAASRLEGHPDNVAPAVFGGLACSLAEPDGTFYSQNWTVHDCWRVVVAIPNFTLETERSRAVLPAQLSRADAIFNLAHLPWLLRGLGEGRADWLRLGCQDRWHQDYRMPLIPGMGQVLQAAQQAGACAAHLSGAGPTLAAWVDARQHDPERVAEAMEEAWLGRARCKVLTVLGQGAHALD
ncbi:homoserine kinase [bacterium]|nr:homoserine kinase [bacterium]